MKQKQIVLKGLSDIGRMRDLNEDSFGTASALRIDWKLQEARGTLVAVADGMGGLAAGEVASKMAIETLFEKYYSGKEKDPTKALAAGFALANTKVHATASSSPTRPRRGTTLVAAVVKGGKLHVANVGDSRLYLVRQGEIRQITQDHSWVADQVRAHVLTEQQAQQHVYKNVVTRAIGSQPDVKVDTFAERLKSNDIIVLASDGLTNMVAPDEIAEIVSSAPDPNQAVQRLIAQANQNGGDDNITAIIVRVPDAPGVLPVVATAAVTLALLAVAAFLIWGVIQQSGALLVVATPTAPPTSAPIIVPTATEVIAPTSAPSPAASSTLSATATTLPTSTPTVLIPTKTPVATIASSTSAVP